MKILSVSFHNLTSLKGGSSIRFDTPPFTETGLFAITGPTGAGKSTILDAVTLALYGRTARLGDGTALFDIITRHCYDAWSEVEFESGEKAYRARLSLRIRGKKQDGTREKKWELSELPEGRILSGHRLQETGQLISGLIGLDYNQFLRSVMLSQGETTRFLRASDNERSELLERITDTFQYSEISAFIYRHTRELEQELNTLKLQLGEVELLSPDTIREKENALEKLRENLLLLTRQREVLSGQIRWHEQTGRLEETMRLYNLKMQEHNQRAETASAPREKLRIHEKALPFQSRLALIDQAEQDLRHLSGRTLALRTSVPVAATQLENLHRAYINAEKELHKAETGRKQLFLLAEQVQPVDWKIDELNRRIQRQQEEFNLEQTNNSDLQHRIIRNEKEFESTSSGLSGTDAWLEAHALYENTEAVAAGCRHLQSTADELRTAGRKYAEDMLAQEALGKQLKAELQLLTEQRDQLAALHLRTLDALDSERKLHQDLVSSHDLQQLENDVRVLPDQLLLLKEMHLITAAISTEQLKIQEAEENERNIQKHCDELSKLIKSLQEAHEEAFRSLSIHSENIRLRSLIRSYEEARSELTEGNPCPLCGATSHPYAIHLPEGISGSDRQLLQEQEGKVHTLREGIAEKQRELDRAENARDLSASQRESSMQQLQKLRSDFTRYKGVLPFSPEDPALIQKQISATEEAIRRSTEIQEQIRRRDQEIRILENSENTHLRTLSDTGLKLSKLEGELLLCREGYRHLRELNEKGNAKIQQLHEEAGKLLEPFGLLFTDPEIIEKLHKMRGDFLTATEHRRQQELRMGSLQTEIQSLSALQTKSIKRLEESQKVLQALKQELEATSGLREKLFGNKNVAHEKQRAEHTVTEAGQLLSVARNEWQTAQNDYSALQHSLAEQEASLRLQSEELETRQAHFTATIREAGFSETALLRTAYLTEEEILSIRTLLGDLEKEFAHIRQTLAHTAAQLEELRAPGLVTESLEVLRTRLAATETETNETNQATGRLQAQLEAYSQAAKRSEELTAQIGRLSETHTAWKRLSNLIGSADGKSFRNFAQGITLHILIMYANKRLAGFTDRYQLHKTEGEDLGFAVTDLYQAGIRRSVNTLSGGESFLVSLALALGLSDLAGSKTRIGSLFIDEGFGTLDPETLDTALTALEHLQTGGKLVGIISHVSTLSERIGVQIRVEKLPGGHSRLLLGGYRDT